VTVSLEWYELSRAALVGVSRNVEALRMGCHNRMPINDEWSIHVLGASGECAFAKATNRYWSGGVNTFKATADIGGSIEIRTRSKHIYDLIVRDDDGNDSVFVLVTGGPKDFVVHGWMRGGDAKRPEFLANHGNHGAAYFVPKGALRPLSELEVMR
jgi:hypothetical protein